MNKICLLILTAVFISGAGAAWSAQGHGGHGEYSDRAFLSGMIAHHEDAMDMSRKALKDATDRRVQAWARNIMDAQQDEIATMRRLLGSYGGMDHHAAQAMRHMDMSSHAGKNADRMFVDAMLEHHKAALDMSAQALLHSRDPEVLDLAEQIIRQQAEEMRGFKSWQAEKY